jgi:hypothetical protein
MSRNKIEQNKKLFQKLYERIRNKEYYEIADCVRYIRTDELERKWLTDAVINNFTKIAKDTYSIAIQLDEIEYIFLTGISANENIESDEIESISINAGIATVLAGEGLLAVSSNTPDSTIVEFLYDTSEVDYKGHDWKDISILYSEIVGYRIGLISANVKTSNLREYYWIVLNILTRQDAVFHNSYSIETIEVWRKLVIEKYSEQISYRGIMYAFCAANWEITFLHLYQCIEDVFTSQPLKVLYDKLDINTGFFDFESVLLDTLNWKANAESALSTLINRIDQTNTGYQLLQKYANKSGWGVETWVYKMRNKIVHQSSEALIACNDHEKWDEVIRGMLYFISSII